MPLHPNEEKELREKFKSKFGINGWMVPEDKIDPIADYWISLIASREQKLWERIEKLLDTGGPFEQEWRQGMQSGRNTTIHEILSLLTNPEDK